ncbi:MAG: cytochrome c [Paracoccaceae bacterium]
MFLTPTRLAGGILLLSALACTPVPPPVSRGQALYSDYCAGCHGTEGRGDGPAAVGLKHRPADLTRIAARRGGTFPLARVMSVIDGYTRRNDHGSVMPEMGAVIAASPEVMVDTGDGVPVPVPGNLLALADYLRSIQRP